MQHLLESARCCSDEMMGRGTMGNATVTCKSCGHTWNECTVDIVEYQKRHQHEVEVVSAALKSLPEDELYERCEAYKREVVAYREERLSQDDVNFDTESQRLAMMRDKPVDEYFDGLVQWETKQRRSVCEKCGARI